MKKYFYISGFFSLVFFLTAGIVSGQGFIGPNTPGQPVAFFSPVSVSEVRNLPKDSWIVLSGNIVHTLPGGKYYTFRDSSGEITVEIEPKVWRGLSVDPSDNIVIHGKVEVKKALVSIEAKAVFSPARTGVRQGQAVTITQSIFINEAKNLSNKSWIILSGNIVNSLGKDKYTFRDLSGEIVIEIEKKVWRGLSVSVSDRVEIHGELEIKKGQYSMEVKAIKGL